MIMKTNITTYILGAGLLLSSCADLDQTSISSIDKENFYQNESDIKVALNGIYQQLTTGGMNAPGTMRSSISTTCRVSTPVAEQPTVPTSQR